MSFDSLGILPCAGQQSRMKELTFSKELLPLFDSRPVIQHSIDTLRRATSDLIAVVNPKKKDLIRYLKRQNVTVIQARTDGPISTLALAAQKTTLPLLFTLTDTYFQPEDVFIQLINHKQSNVLGLFDSGTPERFDSVLTRGDKITRYKVKVDPPLSRWTMGCGKISPQAFKLAKKGGEVIFGHLFEPLTKKGLLYGLKLQNSSFYDLGTPQNYIEYLIKRYSPNLNH